MQMNLFADLSLQSYGTLRSTDPDLLNIQLFTLIPVYIMTMLWVQVW